MASSTAPPPNLPKSMVYKFPKFNWDMLRGAVLMLMITEGNHHKFVFNMVKHTATIEFDGFHFETKHFDEHGIIDFVSLEQSLGFLSITSVRKAGGNTDEYQQMFLKFKSADEKKEMICAVKNLVITIS